MENFIFETAKNFSKSKIETFKKALINAGQVTEKSFPGLIAKNPRLLIIGDTDDPTGIGALKIPNESYKTKVFKNSKSIHYPDHYDFELGWVVSKKKGNGRILVNLLANSHDSIYATVREDNLPMIHLLLEAGLIQSGIPFMSDRDNYNILLFIKPNKQE